MKLSDKTLSKLIKGACYFETKDGYSDRAHHNSFGSLMYSNNLIKAIKKLKF